MPATAVCAQAMLHCLRGLDLLGVPMPWSPAYKAAQRWWLLRLKLDALQPRVVLSGCFWGTCASEPPQDDIASRRAQVWMSQTTLALLAWPGGATGSSLELSPTLLAGLPQHLRGVHGASLSGRSAPAQGLNASGRRQHAQGTAANQGAPTTAAAGATVGSGDAAPQPTSSPHAISPGRQLTPLASGAEAAAAAASAEGASAWSFPAVSGPQQVAPAEALAHAGTARHDGSSTSRQLSRPRRIATQGSEHTVAVLQQALPTGGRPRPRSAPVGSGASPSRHSHSGGQAGAAEPVPAKAAMAGAAAAGTEAQHQAVEQLARPPPPSEGATGVACDGSPEWPDAASSDVLAWACSPLHDEEQLRAAGFEDNGQREAGALAEAALILDLLCT